MKKLGEAEVVGFKTYVRDDAPNIHAHLFEPLIKKERKVRVGKSWDEMLEWVDENPRNIARQLTLDIKRKLKDVVGLPRGRYLCFYKGRPSTKSIFAAFVLTKNYLKIRIRTDPTTFRDPKKLVKEKVYSGWFFKTGQEREFKVTEKEQMDYAMELIRQSYDMR